MTIPTPYVLQVKPYVAGVEDHGNTTAGYGAARDWWVHCVAPGAMVEPGEPNRDVSNIAYTVLAPASDDVPSERDRVVYGGVEYDVNGRPADWTKGPWQNPVAGFSVELRRVEG